MHKGAVFIVPNDTIHHAMPKQDDLVTSSVIFFSPALIQSVFIEEKFSYLSIIENIKKHKHYKLSLASDQQDNIEKILNQIEHELSNKNLGFKHAALLYTHQMLLYLSRFHIKEMDEPYKENSLNGYWMNEIFSYIDHNLTANLSLTLLADKAHVSSAHFSRVFKEVTGMSLTVYLNKKRTSKAKELLWKTSYSVSEIAELSGFESIPHFYRTFKKFTGSTPAKYRKNDRL